MEEKEVTKEEVEVGLDDKDNDENFEQSMILEENKINAFTLNNKKNDRIFTELLYLHKWFPHHNHS